MSFTLCRLCETSLTEKCAELEGIVHVTRSIGLARSQEPSFPEDLMVRAGTQCRNFEKGSSVIEPGLFWCECTGEDIFTLLTAA